MSFLDFFTAEKEEATLLLDVGNGTISGSLVSFKKGYSPKFLCNVKISIPVMENVDGGWLSKNLASSLDTVVSNLLEKFAKTDRKGKRVKIVATLVSLSSPWFLLKTKAIHLRPEEDFIITPKFLAELSQKEEKIFEKELIKNNPVFSKSSFEIIERSIIHAKINGYVVNDILGRKTRSLDAFLCISIVDKKVYSILLEVLFRHLHVPAESILMHTFPVIFFTIIRDLYPRITDFFIFDITGEVTDITLVQSNAVTGSVSFPSGRNFILRQIAEAFKVSLEIAESNLRLYVDKKLDEKSIKTIEGILVNIEKEWSIYLENALNQLSPEFLLPSTVYMTSDNDVSPIFEAFLKLDKVDGTASFRKNAKINIITNKTLGKFYEGSTPPQDQFISILTIFYNKIFQK